MLEKKCRALAMCCGLTAALASQSATAQTATSTDAWRFELTPYLWTPGIRSDLQFGPLPGNTVSVNSTSLLKALEMGAMGSLEARKGAWGGLLDLQYVKLGVSNQYLGGLAGGYDVTFKQTIVTLAGLYRVVDTPGVTVDAVGGIRYVNLKTNVIVSIAPTLRGPGRRIEDTANSTSGILGARVLVPVGDKWSLLGYLDIGAGNSNTNWQAIAGANYQYSPATAIKLGYRYLSYKRDDELVNRAAMGGFYVGLGFRF
ncbi:hypothetical protein [Variovorax rhizosphaerae]|uniref:Outer membrane protein beta-barrel domain-containing protein n=1 Tax=Variovorax rhizosphaerae TaxID=1836200 RepID=A0ABU8WJR7_9BURK